MLHEGRGEVYPPLDELNEMVWQAHRQGFQVALHAVEEGPICAALEAIETGVTTSATHEIIAIALSIARSVRRRLLRS